MRNKTTRVLLRILLIVLAAALVFGAVYPAFAAVPPVDEEKVTAQAVILFDQETGQILYSKNADEKLAPASTTKLMTCVLAMEHAKLEDEVKVGQEVQVVGTRMGLKPGDTVTVESLLYGMLLVSGNDAAAAMAVHIAGSLEAFAEMMNEKAAELGMKDSHFVTVSGRDAEGHLVTAADMLLITREALKYETITKIAKMTTATVSTVDGKKSYELKSTNRLLYSGEGIGDGVDYRYRYATGLKTGSTPNAGKCIVATAEKDGQKLGVLIYGDQSDEGVDRWSICPYLFDYGFENYTNIDTAELIGQGELRVAVEGAAVGENLDGTVVCELKDPFSAEGNTVMTVPRESADSLLSYTITPSPGVRAPLKKGAVVGTIEYKMDDEVVFSGQVVAASDVMSQQEYDTQIVQPVDPEEVDERPKVATAAMWWWLLVPAALIIFLIVRAIVKRRRRRYIRRRGYVPHRWHRKKHRRRRY